jgi:hypothetical protein
MDTTIELTISEIPIRLVTASQSLLKFLSEYFQYYQPRKADSPGAKFTGIWLELYLLSDGESPLEMIPADAVLVAESGIARLRKGTPKDRERFYFEFGRECFVLDPTAGGGRAWITPEAMESPHILVNTYLMFALLLLLRARPVYHLHAAAVLSPAEELWLICGPQRAGKTTLTTALGIAGWRPISDDTLLIDFDGECPRLWALKKAFHLSTRLLDEWNDLKNLPRSAPHLDRTSVDGLRFFGAADDADRYYRKIDHIVIPQIIEGAQSRWSVLGPAECRLRLAEQSPFFQIWPDHTRRQWEALLKLAHASRDHEFFSAADILANPRLVAVYFNEMTK